MDNATEQIFLLSSSVSPSCNASQKIVEVPSTPQVNLENVEDLSRVCRTCAAVTEFLIPIFHGEGLQNSLADKIHKHLPIQVTEQDILPRAVCYQCMHTLLAWHELVMCCEQADQALRTHVHKTQQPSPTEREYQEKKPTTNEEGQSLDNKEYEFGAYAVPPPPYEEPRTRTCHYCNSQHPEASYKQHLFNDHTELLFHCEECDAYVDKKDFIPHMSVHAVEYATNQEKETKKVKKVKKKKEVKEEKNNVHNKVENVKTAEDMCVIQDNVIETFQEQDEAYDKYKNKIEIEIYVSPEKTASINVIKHQDNKSQENEFSDHSDTDFDFGPLPESVFEAIEDSEDSEPLDSTDTTILIENSDATNHVNNTSDTAESPTKKEKKYKRTRTCPICSKVYNASSSYFYHMKYFHKRSKEHECNICKRRFGTKGSLNEHATIHTGECQFGCKECGKRFRAKASLYIHEQTHKGIKTYSCSQCQISFRWRTHLQRHIKRHSAEKSHACSICGRGFSIRCDLLRHTKTHTAGNFTCDKCGVKFAQLRYLKVHMDKKHSASIVADQTQNVQST